MTEMRERLIELLIKEQVGCYAISPTWLADHLIANGVILPPCKVGDTVYIIDEPDFADNYVLDVKVSGIGQDVRGMWINMDLPLGMRLSQYVFPNNLGKTVFLTREEAEKECEGK